MGSWACRSISRGLASVATIHADVVCIGGGVVGSAAAYFLTQSDAFDGTVAVVERDPTYTTASSALSGSSIREQFSDPVNIKASQYGMSFIKDFHEHVQVEGEAPDIGFVGTGYLFLATDAGIDQLRSAHRTQVEHGADVALLSPSEVATTFPYLNVDGLSAGRLGTEREGSFDAWALLQGFKRRATHDGATYLQDQVVAIDTSGGRVTSVQLRSGDTIECSHVINSAGPRAGDIAAMVNLEIPVEPRVRSLFVFDCRTPIEGRVPLTITPEGVHYRREQNQFICGVSPTVDPRADHDDFKVRHAEFEEIVWPALARWVPQFDRISVTASWAGHYAVNTLDANMVIGPVPGLGNFYLANGFSGHGLQHSPAVGRALSELITTGQYQTIDMTDLGYQRLVEGTAKEEVVVI